MSTISPTPTPRRTWLERIAGVPAPLDDGLAELPDDAPKGTRAATLLAGQQLAALRAMQQSMTELTAQLQGFLTNNVLGVELVTLDATGQAWRQFKAQCGALIVRNLGAASMTLVQGNPGGAPTSGHGVWIIPANSKDTIAINETTFTVFGTATQQFEYQAFTRAVSPSS